MPQYDAFVSYSHSDEALLKPVVKLLAVGKRKIFWDAQIEPGEPWMDRIGGALADSATFIVLWCCHAAESRYVDAEIEHALARKTPVVPVFLCPYPIRDPLGKIQGIDLRAMAHSCPTWHAAGEDFDQAETMSRPSEMAVDEVPPAYAPRRLWRAASSVVRSTVGAFLILLAILQPFASTLSAKAATGVNFTIGFIGLILYVLGLRFALELRHLSVRRRRLRVALPSEVLAGVIETAILQAKGEPIEHGPKRLIKL